MVRRRKYSIIKVNIPTKHKTPFPRLAQNLVNNAGYHWRVGNITTVEYHTIAAFIHNYRLKHGDKPLMKEDLHKIFPYF